MGARGAGQIKGKARSCERMVGMSMENKNHLKQ
jgi:hypothetical protein